MILLKYLAILTWRPEEAQKVTDLYLKWKIPEGLIFILTPHNILGANKSVSVCEASDEALAKVDRYWRQVCNIEIMPLMDVRELIKIRP